MTSNWYVLAVHSRKENFVETQLAARKLKAVCPRYVKITRHARSKRQVMAPLFPGYIFVEFCEHGRNWREVNAIAGSIGLLRLESRPLPLNCVFVSRFISNQNEKGVVEFKQSFSPGDRVQAIGGPFDQKIGEVIKMSDKERVQVLIEGLNRSVNLSLPQTDLVAAA